MFRGHNVRGLENDSPPYRPWPAQLTAGVSELVPYSEHINPSAAMGGPEPQRMPDTLDSMEL